MSVWMVVAFACHLELSSYVQTGREAAFSIRDVRCRLWSGQHTSRSCEQRWNTSSSSACPWSAGGTWVWIFATVCRTTSGPSRRWIITLRRQPFMLNRTICSPSCREDFACCCSLVRLSLRLALRIKGTLCSCMILGSKQFILPRRIVPRFKWGPCSTFFLQLEIWIMCDIVNDNLSSNKKNSKKCYMEESFRNLN